MQVGYNHLISNKRKGNNCFIKTPHKISRILPNFICKTTNFQLVFNFGQTRTVTILGGHGIGTMHNGSYTMMAKPIIVCYAAVFSVVTQCLRGGALRDETKDGCAAD